jgi:hypothetical protein
VASNQVPAVAVAGAAVASNQVPAVVVAGAAPHQAAAPHQTGAPRASGLTFPLLWSENGPNRAARAATPSSSLDDEIICNLVVPTLLSFPSVPEERHINEQCEDPI